MMESLNDWKFDNLPQFGWAYRPPVRHILVQGSVRSPGMVVRRKQSFEVPIVEDDDVIQKLSA